MHDDILLVKMVSVFQSLKQDAPGPSLIAVNLSEYCQMSC